MGRFVDLTGRQFTEWAVLQRGEDKISPKGYRTVMWDCQCSCGRLEAVRGKSLINGESKSCGHCNDIVIGKRYNEWVEPIEKLEDIVDFKSGKHKSQFRAKCHYGAKGCIKYFNVRAFHLFNGKTNSCGCLQRDVARKRFSGSNNPNWCGGVADLYVLVRTCGKNDKWKEDVFERDNYTCQKCGDFTGGNLNVHHAFVHFITLLEELIKQGITDVKDISDDSELWNVDNGSTLCTKCHKEAHSLFKGGCTKEKFIEWLKIKEERIS